MVDVTSANFKEEVLTSDLPVVVDFWAPWCGPCKAMAPLLGQVDAEGVKTVKVNVDDAPDLATKYKIRGVPTLIILKGGEEVDRHTGSLTLDQLQAFYDKASDT